MMMMRDGGRLRERNNYCQAECPQPRLGAQVSSCDNYPSNWTLPGGRSGGGEDVFRG